MTRPPRTTPDAGFQLCSLCDGSRLCSFCGGDGDNDGKPCTFCDYGTCSQCRGEGQMPASWKPPSRVPYTLTFEQGHETAADSPWGFQRLQVTTEGQLEYQHRTRGKERRILGTIDPLRVDALVKTLDRTSFPEKPQETFQPGTSIIRLTLAPPTYSVLIDYFDGMQMDGYREIIRDLSDLNNALREANAEALAAWRFEAAA